MIEYVSPQHGEITLYKAQRGFQEATPSVRNITTDGNLLHWDDGETSYTLKMEPLSPGKTNAAAAPKTP